MQQAPHASRSLFPRLRVSILSLGLRRWHAGASKSRLTEPLARSGAKKSLDGTAGTQALQNVA